MIKHIIFDCFGTLIDTGSGSLKAAAQILLDSVKIYHESHKYEGRKEYPIFSGSGVELIESFYSAWKEEIAKLREHAIFMNEKTIFMHSLGSMFVSRNKALSAAIGEAVYGEYDYRKLAEPMIKTLFGERHAFSEVKDTLIKIDNMGLDTALASNTDNDSLEHFLEQNGINFERKFTSEDLELYKPNPGFYKYILNETGWQPEECLFVGDSYQEDIVGPHYAGMKTLLVLRDGKSIRTDGICSPDRVLTSLELLPDILAGEGI